MTTAQQNLIAELAATMPSKAAARRFTKNTSNAAKAKPMTDAEIRAAAAYERGTAKRSKGA